MGTFFRFWVPKRSPFFSRSPLSPFQAEEKSEQPLFIKCWPFDYLWWQNNENGTNLCTKWSHPLWRSPLGPYITLSWVPIGSPFWTKLGPHGTWEQCHSALKSGSPLGTPHGDLFSVFGSPLDTIRSPCSILGLWTREKSVQPPEAPLDSDYLNLSSYINFFQLYINKRPSLNSLITLLKR